MAEQSERILPMADSSRTPVHRGSTRPTSSVTTNLGFYLMYLALGALIIEGAVGLGMYYNSTSASPGTATGGTAVPNGPAASFELKAYMTGYIGVNGSINGVKDPTLNVGWGDHVTIALVDGEDNQHDLHVDGYNLQTSWVYSAGQETSLTFQATLQGSFDYYCTFPGHRESGMQGLFVVGPATNPIGSEANLSTPFISHDPTDIPPPIIRNYSATVNIYLHAAEETAEIEPGVSYTYWTYNGTVPGPFFRVRVNDTVVVHFYNDPTSGMNHSVDFHAVTGPGGGAGVDQTAPGHWSNFSFLARMPGLFVYHCGTPNIPTHIANGMFGMILVQPSGGLPPVDHEFYLMESELYLDWPIHTLGNQLFNGTALLNDDPTYVVFNGRYDAFTGIHELHAAVNDSVRIFFGDIGPNDFSAFHIIGTILDTVWPNGDLIDPPSHGVQTVPVPPGSALVTDLTMVYPANYLIVDHSIVNAIDKGAYAVLDVTGWANGTIFHPDLNAPPPSVMGRAPTPPVLAVVRIEE